ncbi:hypothetical protein DSQ20_05630 [Nitrosarchaeum sp. AC2]|nr:hypothetical protein DSQ20_05630 [Nitrosarchaeum sp. AC2]
MLVIGISALSVVLILFILTLESFDPLQSYEVNTICDLVDIVEGPNAAAFWDHRYSLETMQKYASEKQKIAEEIAKKYWGIEDYSGSWQDLPPEFWEKSKLIDEKILQDEPFHYQINPKLFEEYGGPDKFLLNMNEIIQNEKPNC